MYFIASIVLSIYALIGLVITIQLNFDTIFEQLISLLMFFIIPALGVYGSYYKKRWALAVACCYFLFRILKSGGSEHVYFAISPISLSFAFGDFSQGQGYLIDFFAICMTLGLFRLIQVETKRKHSHE
ncbi:hypothetical protein PA25_14710 [Pseudoalteromonas sp. A25]|uniref:hypothetical protein n=1 Tax=Pseudoalteromonas sp. A25 TaxID=116092 RepID=UPI001261359B|nr:hypothetical protein [Pseudoalteromonas sp. A25]BBN81486.1 hypothetical protein PA25_14710 [Pseudoalteromonas sp. A25]